MLHLFERGLVNILTDVLLPCAVCLCCISAAVRSLLYISAALAYCLLRRLGTKLFFLSNGCGRTQGKPSRKCRPLAPLGLFFLLLCIILRLNTIRFDVFKRRERHCGEEEEEEERGEAPNDECFVLFFLNNKE